MLGGYDDDADIGGHLLGGDDDDAAIGGISDDADNIGGDDLIALH